MEKTANPTLDQETLAKAQAEGFIIEGTCLVGYKGENPDVIVPEGITVIGTGAFDSCQIIRTLHLPSTIEFIMYQGIRDCYNLVSVNIPASCKTIGAKAFMLCVSLERVEFEEGPTMISDQMFSFCYSLKSITLPKSLRYIAGFAFQRCRSLESATILNEHAKIHPMAFEDCNNLKTVYLGGRPQGSLCLPEGCEIKLLNN